MSKTSIDVFLRFYFLAETICEVCSNKTLLSKPVCQTELIKLCISELLASRMIGKRWSCAVPSLQNTLENQKANWRSSNRLYSVQFPAKFNCGTAERRMLPSMLCWGCTVHKMQGTTVWLAVVNLGSKLFATGQAYTVKNKDIEYCFPNNIEIFL
jgi:hypothetical protein